MSTSAALGTGLAATLALAAASGCQPGISTTPAIAPLPPLALGLQVFLAPEPTIAQVEDPAARPLADRLHRDIRDTLEEAGFRLASKTN